MMKAIVPLVLIMLLVGAGVGYIFFSPSDSNQADSISPTPAQIQTTNSSQQSPGMGLKGIPAVKSYAAMQFNKKEDQVTVVRSEKQTWDDICLGMEIPDYDCTKKQVTGYEVVVEIDGVQTTYRGSDDGSIIRILKAPSSEESTPEASPSPTEE